MDKFFCFLFSGLLLTVCGCSSVVNAHRQKQKMMTAYEQGDPLTALKTAEHKLDPSSWGSAAGSGDEIHWRLEAGALSFHCGSFPQAVRHFSAAEHLIRKYDERALISVRDIGSEAAAVFTNLNALPYRGFCRDRIALPFYLSLAYLGCGREDSFYVQLKRLRQAQNRVKNDYRRFFEQEKKAAASFRRQNPETAKQADRISSSKFTENARNRDLARELQKIRSVAHKGYGNFLNPAAIFLSGLGFLRKGDHENALIDFKHLYEAMPGNPLAQKYYASALRRTGRSIPAALQKVRPFDFSLSGNCVYVISALGRSAAFKQIAVYFPVTTAWPVCEFYTSDFDRMTADAGGRNYPGYILADMDGIIAREFRERLPLMITRIAISTAIKETAAHAGTYMMMRSNTLAGVAVGAGSAVYTAVMNTADTRTWEVLPKEFHLTQLPMPADRKITVRLNGRKQAVRQILLPENCRSAILFVSAPVSSNIICHVLPLSR